MSRKWSDSVTDNNYDCEYLKTYIFNHRIQIIFSKTFGNSFQKKAKLLCIIGVDGLSQYQNYCRKKVQIGLQIAIRFNELLRKHRVCREHKQVRQHCSQRHHFIVISIGKEGR